MAIALKAGIRRKLFVALVALTGLIAFLVVVFVSTRSFWDPQWNLTISRLVDSAPSRNGVSNAVERTAEVCEPINCVEAYETTEATYLRFESREDASQYSGSGRDTFQSNYIVMDFSAKSSIAPERQRLAMEYLAGMWQDFEGSVPQRG